MHYCNFCSKITPSPGKHAKRFASRLRKHKDKLARYEANLAAIQKTMDLATK